MQRTERVQRWQSFEYLPISVSYQTSRPINCMKYLTWLLNVQMSTPVFRAVWNGCSMKKRIMFIQEWWSARFSFASSLPAIRERFAQDMQTAAITVSDAGLESGTVWNDCIPVCHTGTSTGRLKAYRHLSKIHTGMLFYKYTTIIINAGVKFT